MKKPPFPKSLMTIPKIERIKMTYQSSKELTKVVLEKGRLIPMTETQILLIMINLMTKSRTKLKSKTMMQLNRPLLRKSAMKNKKSKSEEMRLQIEERGKKNSRR